MGNNVKGIYLHIPFCRSKCAYCAFNSYPVAGYDPDKYMAALSREIEFWSQRTSADQFKTLFVGGGTPTILAAGKLAELFALVRDKFKLAADAEITVESNPNTLDSAKLATLRKAGVNRLSIGIQSFDDRTLRIIDRTHSGAEGRKAIAMAREAGFDNLNLDLIYGLPGQTANSWRQNLEEALSLAPEHLAAYQLSIDPGSRFSDQVEKGGLNLPDEDETAAMAEITLELCCATALERYEISNYARPDRECRHNLIYWHNGNYLGMGAGAVSYWAGFRIRNLASPDSYIKRLASGEPPWQEAEALDREASFRETMIMGLRLVEGVKISVLRKRFSIDPAEYYGGSLDKLVKLGLLKITAERVLLTRKGLVFANQVMAELV